MIKTTLAIEGMACNMCEAHVNDAIRKALDVKKVKSSHKKNQTVILSENVLDEQAIRTAVDETGYKLLEIKSEPASALF